MSTRTRSVPPTGPSAVAGLNIISEFSTAAKRTSRWKRIVRYAVGTLATAGCLSYGGYPASGLGRIPVHNERRADAKVSQSPFPIRGIKGLWWEGFPKYQAALPWLAQHGMNFMMLCYTSFPESGQNWRRDYSVAEMNGFRDLAEQGRMLGVDVCVSFNPGLYSQPPLVYSNPQDFMQAERKVVFLSAVGVRTICVCLDDIGRDLQPADKAKYGTLQNAQSDFINRLRAVQKRAYHGHDHPRFIFCPSAYTTADASAHLDYIQTIGEKMDPDVMMFWTGPDVCSKTITAEDADKYAGWIRRKPIVWDNYPVNDMFPWRPLLAPVKGREPALSRSVSGFIANPMKQWEPSKIPLATLADYLNDPVGYKPAVSIEKAIRSYPVDEQSAIRQLVSVYGSAFLGESGYPPQPHGSAKLDVETQLAVYRKLNRLLSIVPNLASLYADVFPTLQGDIKHLEKRVGVYHRVDPLAAVGDEFDGGAGELFGYQRYDRNVNYVYAQPTDRREMHVDFQMPQSPKSPMSLLMTARDDDSGKKLSVKIMLNGKVLSTGPSPFTSEGFTTRAFRIPNGTVVAGANRLSIENLEPAGPLGGPPWFMVSGARLVAGEKSGNVAATTTGAAAHVPDAADTVALAELKGTADPTYAGVARHFPPMKHPRELIGVATHEHAIGIDTDGKLQFCQDAGAVASPRAWFLMGGPPLPIVANGVKIERRLVDGYLPMVVLSGVHDGVKFEQTAFGWCERFSPTKDLYAYVRLHLSVHGLTELPSHVYLTHSPSEMMDALYTRSVGSNPRSGDIYVRIPFNSPERCEVLDGKAFDSAFEATKSYWHGLLSKGMQLDLPNPHVSAAWKAWIAYSLLDVHQRNGFDEPHDGTGFYDLVYGFSAAQYCVVLDLYGLHDQARRCLDCLIHFQQPDGLYTQNYGLPDQGVFLSALAEHLFITRDKAWFEGVREPLIKACDWLILQRRAANGTGLTKGMIKYRPYCDYAGETYNYVSDVNCCMGLERAADALFLSGHEPDARRVREQADLYRVDLVRSLYASSFVYGGHIIVPIEPDTHRLEKTSGFRGGEYYGLLASCLLETEFLGSDEPVAKRITKFMESEGGLTAGLCRFDTGIDHAYSYGYLLTQLKRGDARRYLLGFYGMLAYGMTPDTFAGVEVTKLMTGENADTLPHLYSCTQQLKTLRTMLIREDEHGLHLGEAMPRAWLEDGKRVAVRNAPTRLGEVSYTIRSRVALNRIEVELTLPKAEHGGSVRLRLRHPRRAPIKRVVVDGKAVTTFNGEDVRLAGLGKRSLVRVEY